MRIFCPAMASSNLSRTATFVRPPRSGVSRYSTRADPEIPWRGWVVVMLLSASLPATADDMTAGACPQATAPVCQSEHLLDQSRGASSDEGWLTRLDFRGETDATNIVLVPSRGANRGTSLATARRRARVGGL